MMNANCPLTLLLLAGVVWWWSNSPLGPITTVRRQMPEATTHKSMPAVVAITRHEPRLDTETRSRDSTPLRCRRRIQSPTRR
jgi:hypothetical protein